VKCFLNLIVKFKNPQHSLGETHSPPEGKGKAHYLTTRKYSNNALHAKQELELVHLRQRKTQ